MSDKGANVPKGDAQVRALNQAFPVVRYGADGRITDANNHFLGLMGYGLEEVIGLEATAFFSSTLTRHDQAGLWEGLRRGERCRQTCLWITKAGREVWLDSRYVPIACEDGSVEEIVKISQDVSGELSRQADERGQIEAIEASQAVIHFALDGTILGANDIFLKAVGYEAGEVIGRHHAMFVDPAERDGGDYREFWEALGSGQHRSGEYRRIAKDGSTVWLQAVYSPIFDPAGRPLKIVKYAADITAEKIRKADYQWQITAIHKSNSVITFDMYGTILDANDLFLEATGYALDEIQGRHHRMFVEASHGYSAEYAMFWNDLRQGKHRAGQYKRFCRDGREIWLQATYNPIFDAAGKPIKVVKYASVVTEERLVQADHQGQIAAINHAQCVISFELDGTIIDANANFLDLVGYRYGDVRGQHHRMFVDPHHAGSAEYQGFWRDLAAGRHQAGEYKRIGKGGRELWLQATYNPIRDLDGRVFKVIKYATDITAEKLRQADDRGQIAAINRSQGVVVFALDGTILDINENLLAMLGYERGQLIGRHHSVLVEKSVAASADYASFWATLRSGAYHAGMYKRIGKDGKEVWIQASYNPILDLDGKPTKVVKFANDVSSNVALAEAFDEARRQANHDSATSLPNRMKLSAHMNSCLADPAGNMVVFYIDLDRFKPINDTFGHHVGDRVLGEVADRLRRALRDDQMVARVGGDEFVIAAPGMPVDAIERFCKNLYQLVTVPIRHDDGDITVGMSVGIAIAPTDGRTPDELLRAADAALYRSKQDGRGIYSYFSSDLNTRIIGQRKLAEEMRNSLTVGDFFLEFQPRLDTRTRCVRSFEALVRWAHPERGRISPAEFIPMAEHSGLIVPLGTWILNTACQAAAAWDGVGVSVNVSPIQFRDANLIEHVERALRESGLPAALLELEITEGVLIEDAGRALEMLAGLKALGVKLAMDDFGTGYSSLSYLRNFPFDVIKIDRSFIQDLDARTSARPIVQAILGLGQALGLSVTAEGVETDAQLDLLDADQCDEIQGFLMSRPLSLDQVEEFLKRSPEPDDGSPELRDAA